MNKLERPGKAFFLKNMTSVIVLNLLISKQNFLGTENKENLFLKFLLIKFANR